LAYFPDSIAPSRLKDESQDVRGNPFIITATDHNKHDEEIRAIEKVVGPRLPSFPGEGFSGYGNVSPFEALSCPIATCYPPVDSQASETTAVGMLRAILDKLAEIRNDQFLLTSGVVAVKDDFVAGVDRVIPFPSDWHTTLAEDVVDDTRTDEQAMPPLPSVAVDDVDGMPSEGHVTIINGMDTAPVFVPTVTDRPVFITPLQAMAKVGSPFSLVLEVAGSGPFEFAKSLPLGAPSWISLAQSGSQAVLSGTPPPEFALGTASPVHGFGVTSIQMTISCRDTKTGTATAATIRLLVAHAGTPTMDDALVAGSVGEVVEYIVPIRGLPTGVVHGPLASSLAPGLTRSSNVISGTPANMGKSEVEIEAIDPFGGASTGEVTFLVGPRFQVETVVGEAQPSPMSITSVTPGSGPLLGGTRVTITGRGFGSVFNSVSVSFGVNQGVVRVVEDTRIIVESPTGVKQGEVILEVRIIGGIPARFFFVYTGVPVPAAVTEWIPQTGPAAGGTLVTIIGTGLSSAVEVLFGGVLATVVTNTPTEIIVRTPAHAAGVVTIQIQFGSGESVRIDDAFTYA
jgi:hypothetical protein